MLRMTYVSGKDGKRERWVLTSDTGVIVAKLYAKPTIGNIDNLVHGIDSASVGYRVRVNARCETKGYVNKY